MGFFTLIFPILLGILLLFIIFWLIFHPKYALISLVAIIIGWRSVTAFIAFNWPKDHFEKPANSITVMSYNVGLFGLYRDKNSAPRREAIFQLIEQQKPDIACFQDFYTSEKRDDFNNREDISLQMGLPYRFFSSDFNRNGMQHWGSIIFSKYPIIQSDKIKLSKGPRSESLIFADILKDEDTLRIINMHLESYRFNEEDYNSIEKIKKSEDKGLVATKGIIEKMREAFIRRAKQANIVDSFIRESPHPVIVCGDFNDTPASYTYFTVKGDLQDAFLQKGSGIGRTFASLSPTLRIDYIFAGNTFAVNHFKKLSVDLSDHYPVIANMHLIKTQEPRK
ncbi:endonuclease/exonuclease/phosphatase [Chitinophaga caeni]|uniref:Endonuclease/exonuclease/phosphatase n=2 Tax=Chitinophaga caeni TaxID=2029983 RepID=A0A291QRZ8_9BACT|nr:endonuclease/exonuclease/phosphatase [Chitinophaga caeni]